MPAACASNADGPGTRQSSGPKASPPTDM